MIDFAKMELLQKFLLLGGGFLLLYSCGSRSDDLFNAELNKNKKDTFYKQIPLNATGDFGPYYNFVHRKQDLLNWPTLENGVDSFELRIWYAKPMDSLGVLRICFIDDWQVISLVLGPKNNANKEEPNFVLTNSSIYPISGWKSFLNSTAKIGIFSLLTDDEIEKYSFSTHGDLLVIEVAGHDFYKLLGYTNILNQRKNNVEVNKVIELTKYINQQFNLDIISK